MYAATGGPNVKWWDTDFKWGAGSTDPPAGTGPVYTKTILIETWRYLRILRFSDRFFVIH